MPIKIMEYEIVNRLGLHARAAAQLVQTANRFSSSSSQRLKFDEDSMGLAREDVNGAFWRRMKDRARLGEVLFRAVNIRNPDAQARHVGGCTECVIGDFGEEALQIIRRNDPHL